MSTEREILDKQIKDHEAAIATAKAELEKLGVFYSVGDRFKTDSGRKHLLIRHGTGDKALLVCLEDGWRNGISGGPVENFARITPKELSAIKSGVSYTRYWDRQKGVKS